MVKETTGINFEAFEVLLKEQVRRKLMSLLSAKDLNLQTLSERTGLDINTLQALKDGELTATPEQFHLIADACGYFDIPDKLEDIAPKAD